MKKRAVLLSLCLILLSQPAACGKGESPETTADTSQTTETELTTADLIGFGKEDNGGKTFKMLCSQNKSYEYDADELTGDVVSDAIYEKNRSVEDYLGITFEFNFQSNIWNDRGTFNNLIKSDVLSGAGDIDLVQGIVACTMPLTLEGYFIEGKTLRYCDYEKPWWLSDMYSRFSIDGKLYGLIGDASLSLYKDMSVIFFNKRIWDEFKAPNPYDLVRDGEWTLDRFIELASGMSKDLNGDGVYDIASDQLTFTCEIVPAGTFQTALELTLVKLSKDGIPEYSGLTEKFQTAYDKLQVLHQRDDVEHLNTQDSTFDSAKTFAMCNIATMANFIWATEYMRDMKDDYGILPLPKFDESRKITSLRSEPRQPPCSFPKRPEASI